MPLKFGFSRKNEDPLDELTQWLRANPRDVLALIDRAKLSMARREPVSALKDIERTVQLVVMEPDLPGEARTVLLKIAYALQSDALAGIGDYSSALVVAEKLLQEDPNDLESIMRRGRLLRETGQLQRALVDFEAAIERENCSGIAYLGRGLTHAKLGDDSRALADFDKAIELDPNLAIAWSNRGSAYVRLKQWKQAEQSCRTAIELDPWLVQTYDNLSTALVEQGQREAALEVLQKGLEKHPNEPTLLARTAEQYVAIKQYGKGLEAINVCLQVYSEHPDSLRLRASIHFQMRNYWAAVVDCTHALKLEPENAETYFNLALAHYGTRNYNAAIAAIEHSLQINPDDPEARKFLQQIQSPQKPILPTPDTAAVLYALGSFEKAFLEWERSIENARKAGDLDGECDLLIQAGSRLIENGDRAKGEKYLNNALALAKQCKRHDLEAQIHVEFGTLAFGRNRLNDAKSQFEQVLALGKAIANKRYEHLGLGNVGAILAQSGQFHQAIDYLQQARTIATEIHDLYEEMNYCINIGHCGLKLTDPQLALWGFTQAKNLRAALGLTPDAQANDIVERLQRIVSA